MLNKRQMLVEYDVTCQYRHSFCCWRCACHLIEVGTILHAETWLEVPNTLVARVLSLFLVESMPLAQAQCEPRQTVAAAATSALPTQQLPTASFWTSSLLACAALSRPTL